MRAAAGPLVLVAALLGGIGLGGRGQPGAAWPALVLGLVVAAAALAAAAGGAPRRALVVGVLAVGLLGFASMQRARHGLDVSPLTRPVARYAPATIEATLVEDPSGPGRFVADALARVHRADRRVLLVASGDTAGRLRVLAAGDRVTLRGHFRPLTGWEARVRWRHAVGAFVADELVALRGPTSPVLRLANRARALVLSGAASLPSTERALLAGLLLGDTRGVPPATVDAFRASGLTHHLAVSGENVAFVLALCAPLLGRLGYRGRFAGGVAVLVVFGTMTRWEPSVLRAVAMAGCVMLARLLGRPAAGLRVLALAAGALLLADPFLVRSVGFGLSCSATAGIALGSGPIARRLARLPVWTREPIAVTAAAQIGVAPLMIPVFGSIPLASLPANGLAAPLMAPITIGGLGAGVVGGVVRPFVPGAAAVLVWPVGALVRALEGIAAAWASIPVGIGAREAIALVAVGLAVAWFRVRRARGRPARSRPTRGPSVGSPAHVPGGDHEHGRALSHR